MLATLFASIVLIALGLLPSVISFLIERRPGSSGSTCIALFNLAGLIPVLGKVWSGPGGAAFVGDIYAWFIIYMAAAVGAALAWVAPHFSIVYLQAFSGRRRARIKARQQELYDEWGSSILD